MIKISHLALGTINLRVWYHINGQKENLERTYRENYECRK